MSLPTVRGDLLQLAKDGRFDVVIHGCNCQCQMGKGIALTIKNEFPEAYEADKGTIKGSEAKLGTISVAQISRPNFSFSIANAYTQFHWRGTGVKADYEAIRRAMRLVKQRFAGRRIGYPKIGAGLAGGDWSVISKIIEEELAGEDHCYVEYAA